LVAKDSVNEPSTFESLDTVEQATLREAEYLLKLNALFSPKIAFSDTQLIDNGCFRESAVKGPDSFMKLLFKKGAPIGDIETPIIEVCYRPAGEVDGNIDFKRIVANMLSASIQPMHFSSFPPRINIEIKNWRIKYNDKAITYYDFLSFLYSKDSYLASSFNKYLGWLNKIFNKEAHTSRRTWAFKEPGYSRLVETVLQKKDSLYPPKNSTTRVFHNWLMSGLTAASDRTTLRTELLKFKRMLPPYDFNTYKTIIDFPYNYHFADSHGYAMTEKLRTVELRNLFYQAGMLGNKKLTQRAKMQQLDKYKLKTSARIPIFTKGRINLDKLSYSDILTIRSSKEFSEYLINGFYANRSIIQSEMALRQYIEYLAKTLRKNKLCPAGEVYLIVDKIEVLFRLTHALDAYDSANPELVNEAFTMLQLSYAFFILAFTAEEKSRVLVDRDINKEN